MKKYVRFHDLLLIDYVFGRLRLWSTTSLVDYVFGRLRLCHRLGTYGPLVEARRTLKADPTASLSV
jgi:hypothetical protein